MYKIVKGDSHTLLEMAVNKKIKHGWQVVGGMDTDGYNRFRQGMIKIKRKYKSLMADSCEEIAELLNKKPKWATVGGTTVESCDGGYVYYQLIVKEK